MIDWPIGSQIVCVDDSPSIYNGVSVREIGLVKGNIYTVAEIIAYPDGVHVVVSEIPTWLHYKNIHFSCGRFRPVRKTDISVFEKLLVKMPDKVDA